uniref:Uncharacterized protein n=1 Tax=Romanomermis culicivorax TaxID=13658 RepID=A0A915HZH3_ROMCU
MAISTEFNMGNFDFGVFNSLQATLVRMKLDCTPVSINALNSSPHIVTETNLLVVEDILSDLV